MARQTLRCAARHLPPGQPCQDRRGRGVHSCSHAHAPSGVLPSRGALLGVPCSSVVRGRPVQPTRGRHPWGESSRRPYRPAPARLRPAQARARGRAVEPGAGAGRVRGLRGRQWRRRGRRPRAPRAGGALGAAAVRAAVRSRRFCARALPPAQARAPGARPGCGRSINKAP